MKVAILGASYLQEPLLLRAKEMGIETHCFAWAQDAEYQEIADYFYPISIRDMESVLEICEQVQIDGITSIASDTAIPTVSYVAARMGLVANSIASSLLCTDKGRMRNKLKAEGLPVPNYIVYSKGNRPHIDDEFHLPLILKPVDRSGSKGVFLIENFSEWKDYELISLQESFSGYLILEEYDEGREVSVECVSWQGQHRVVTMTDKSTTGAPYFVEMEHHQPSCISDELKTRIELFSLRALEALEVSNGISHIEFLIRSDRSVWILEVGARMGGDFIGSHLVQLSTGFDMLEAAIDIALGSFEMPDTFENIAYAGVYFLAEDSKRLLSHFDRENKSIVKSQIFDEELSKAKDSGDRSGYIIYCDTEKLIL